MSRPLRTLIVVFTVAACGGGLISVTQQSDVSDMSIGCFGMLDPQIGYEFASADLHKFSFTQLEAIVRADVAARFPHTRIELGSVKAERNGLTMNVGLFEPNGGCRLYTYSLVPDKNSWKIAHSQRLWFVPASQIARGLRV